MWGVFVRIYCMNQENPELGIDEVVLGTGNPLKSGEQAKPERDFLRNRIIKLLQGAAGYIPKAGFSGRFMEDWKFMDANLSDAVFNGCRFLRVDFSGANLTGATFSTDENTLIQEHTVILSKETTMPDGKLFDREGEFNLNEALAKYS